MNSSPEGRGLDASLERRIQQEADKLGSVALAKIRLGLDSGSDDGRSVPERSRIPKQSEVKKPRASTRGGRSYNEGSDSDHDPYWSGPRPRLSKEQQQEQIEINRRGRRLARDAQAARMKSASEDGQYEQPVLPVLTHRAQVDASWDAIEAEIERNENQ